MHHLLSSELLQSQESVSQVCDRPCPFCQREYERPIDLQQHVAGHLESIALLSLPNLDDIDENSEAGQANSNSANRNYAESRAGDFDRKEPLVFLEHDLSGDMHSSTEPRKELVSRKLEVESISFDSMNEFSVEAHQGYSSDLAEEWLSRLPIELGEDGGSLSVTPSQPLSDVDLSPRIRKLLDTLDRLHSEWEYRDFSYFIAELYNPLQERLQQMIKRSSLRRLSQTQISPTLAILRDCEEILMDMDDILLKHGSMRERVDIIRSRLSSIFSKLGLLDA